MVLEDGGSTYGWMGFSLRIVLETAPKKGFDRGSVKIQIAPEVELGKSRQP
jgi:hypothetical protein